MLGDMGGVLLFALALQSHLCHWGKMGITQIQVSSLQAC